MNHSIVVPVHNEGAILVGCVEQFLAPLANFLSENSVEIILVENGSRDNTLTKCRLLQKKYPYLIRVIVSDPGYGKALKAGITDSYGATLSVLEIDFLNENFLKASMKLISDPSVDIVIGSKRHTDSVDKRPWRRKVLSFGIGLILRAFFGYKGTDTRGLKTIRTALAKELNCLSETDDEFFQTEIVLIASRLGKKIIEVPVEIEEIRESSGSLLKKSSDFIFQLQRLRRSLNRFR